MRITTRQPATARPELLAVEGVPTAWTTLAEAPDYSVEDTTRTWPNDRDPNDDLRRIQPGAALISTPVYVHNRDTQDRWVEFRVVTEGGTTAMQARVTIPAGDTYSHPIAGITLTKRQIGTANGDRLQMRAEAASVIDVTATVNIGSAEQDQPA